MAESRTKRNQELYEALAEDKVRQENQWTQKTNQLKNNLLSINFVFFNNVYENVDADTKIDNFYNINSLTYKEKLVAIKHELRELYLELVEINDLNPDINLLAENNYSLKPNQNALVIETKLEEINRDLDNLPSFGKLKKDFETDFRAMIGELRDSVIIHDKILNKDKADFKQKVDLQNKTNKESISEIKRSLNAYRLKWIWYLVVSVCCVIGTILAIVIPSVL